MGEIMKFRNAIAVTSGKGGVGKTNISVNLALALQKAGKKVTLFDADVALSNAHIVMGVQPAQTLADVIAEKKNISDVSVKGPLGVKLISGGSGLLELTNLSAEKRGSIIRSFRELEEDCDYLVVDTAAGIDDNVLEFVQACNRIIVVVVGEPAAFIDAYACIKVLHQANGVRNFDIVVNRVRDDAHGADVFKRFKSIVDRFLEANLHHVANIPEDTQLHASVSRCNPVVLSNPNARSAKAFVKLAARIDSAEASPTDASESFAATPARKSGGKR
jgi:flagellar biosynthesis protein FlhG